MSLEKATITWSAKQLSSMVKNNKVNFEHIIQRGEVWEVWRKSRLIESMIIGYPVPVIYAKRVVDDTGKKNSNVYYIMDGKQRLTTVKQFLNDEFALVKLPLVKYMDDELDKECEVDISGMKFSDLPVSLQNHLLTVMFTVTYFDNLTKDEERELFKRLNQGKPLSTKNRTLASAKNIEELLEIGAHELFEKMLSNKAKENKNQVTLVMKTWAMLNKDINYLSFASKDFNPLIEDAEISDAEKEELEKVFNFIVEVHEELVDNKEKDVAKKLFTETHLISLIPYVKQAMENNINESIFSEWLITFFKTENNSEEYNKYMMASSKGVARNTSIVTRHELLGKSYKKFFKIE